MKPSSSTKMSAEQEAELLAELEAMEADSRYNTPARFTTNTDLYPGNSITFSLQHIAYMKKYPSVNPHQYIQNLRMITRIR